MARWRARLVVLAVAAAVIAGAAGASAYAWRASSVASRKAAELTGGNAKLAPDIMRRYGCAGCHAVRHVAAPGGLVGPDLSDIRRRIYIAGVLTNTPDNLVAWIVNPKAVNPKTAMPVTAISEQEARHVAAYLLSMR